MISYELLAQDGSARRGRVRTARGSFETPVFMPVGTRGALVHLDATDYDRLGLEVVLANTYHLMLRPGTKTIAELGGIHAFTGWDGHFLTDSGGFQAMSLGRRPPGTDTTNTDTSPASHELKSVIDDDGITFRSVYDGDEVRLTPERAVEIQAQIGADIQMVLDVCTPLPATEAEVRLAMDRTHDWAHRALAAHRARPAQPTPTTHQAMFGIVQGGIDTDLRRQSAHALASLDFDGYGIGGLSVGETLQEMKPALAAVAEILPATKARYLMGVGDPASLIEAVAAGADMFDCALPTRIARHGTALTDHGKLNLKNARFATDDSPLQTDTPHGGRFSRAYLRHLFSVNEPTAARILTLHNLWFLGDLMSQLRQAIEVGRFENLRTELLRTWS